MVVFGQSGTGGPGGIRNNSLRQLVEATSGKSLTILRRYSHTKAPFGIVVRLDLPTPKKTQARDCHS